MYIWRETSRAQKLADERPGVGSYNIAQRADEHDRANEIDPALGDRHGCSCRRSTNVGIGSEDDVLKIELEQLAENEADQPRHL